MLTLLPAFAPMFSMHSAGQSVYNHPLAYLLILYANKGNNSSGLDLYLQPTVMLKREIEISTNKQTKKKYPLLAQVGLYFNRVVATFKIYYVNTVCAHFHSPKIPNLLSKAPVLRLCKIAV